MAWFDVKFMREVTDLIWREKVLKFADRDTPNSAAVRVGVANLHAHLGYIGYLFEQRNWLAGDHISLADAAAGAQLSVLDYLGDVPWEAHPAPSCTTPGSSRARASGRCSPTARLPQARRPLRRPGFLSRRPATRWRRRRGRGIARWAGPRRAGSACEPRSALLQIERSRHNAY